MTSSPPDEEGPKKVPGWRQPWDTWRLLMMAGSLVLLGLAFSRVGDQDRLPEWLVVVFYAVGYGLLAYGFLLAMRTKKEIRMQRLEEEKKTNKRA